MQQFFLNSMKISPSTKGLLIALVSVVAAFAIYFLFLAKENSYLVDNPTPDTYFFRINKGEEQIIAAGQFVNVNLEKGTNRIQVFDKEKKPLYDSAFQVDKVRGLINITHSDYYINRQFYGYDLDKDSLIAARAKTVIDGKEHVNAPEHFNKLYTEDFYYNVNEEYDGVVKNIQKVESRTKIFRKQDFLNYYKQYYNL